MIQKQLEHINKEAEKALSPLSHMLATRRFSPSRLHQVHADLEVVLKSIKELLNGSNNK
jgi:hypothetical protein